MLYLCKPYCIYVSPTVSMQALLYLCKLYCIYVSSEDYLNNQIWMHWLCINVECSDTRNNRIPVFHIQLLNIKTLNIQIQSRIHTTFISFYTIYHSSFQLVLLILKLLYIYQSSDFYSSHHFYHFISISIWSIKTFFYVFTYINITRVIFKFWKIKIPKKI